MMRPQQQTFDGFDIFEMGGFTRSTVEDHEAAQRKAEQERKARERADEATRQAKAEREARRERERAEEQAQRERDQRRQRTYSRPTAAFDPYTVLGVDYRATGAEIRAAWVRLCKQHHPDKQGGDVEIQKQVNAAYNMLRKKAA